MLGAYLFPKMVGTGPVPGPRQVRQGELHEGLTTVDADYDQKTTELNLNYVIKQFNARVMFFFKNTDFNAVQTRLQAGRRRPPDPDVSASVRHPTNLTIQRRSELYETRTLILDRLSRCSPLAAWSIAHVSAQQATIKVGVLHSLSGTMAISETTLKDTVLMMIDEQNKKGGLLGKKLEAVVVDPASNWPLFAEKARAAAREGQGRRGVRLLDVGVAQVGAAGVREGQRPALLPGAVRR